MNTDPYSFSGLCSSLSNGPTSELINRITRAIQYENFDPKAMSVLYTNRAIAKLSIGLIKSGISDCVNAERSDKSNTMPYLIHGVAELWSGSEQKALRIWNTGLAFGGSIYTYMFMQYLIVDHNLRAHVYNMKHNVQEFTDLGNKFDPRKIFNDSELQEGYYELRNGLVEEAIVKFSGAIIGEDNWRARKGRGVAYCLINKWEEAVSDLSIALEKEKNDIEILKFRAHALKSIGKYVLAINDYSAVINKNPLDYESLIERGKLQMKRKNYKLALSDFAKIRDKTTDLYLIMSDCFLFLGNVVSAFSALKRVEDDRIKKNYNLFKIYEMQYNIDEGMKYLNLTLEKSQDIIVLKSAADFYYNCGDFEQAAKYYLEIMNNDKNDLNLMLKYYLSLLMSKDGDNTFVIQQLKSDDLYFELYNEDCINNNQKIYEHLIHILNNYNCNYNNSYPNTNLQEDIIQKFRNEFLPDKSFFSYCFPTEIEIQMINDAETLGNSCISLSPDCIPSRRLKRCIGFCILSLTQKLKENNFSPKDYRWIDAVKEIQSILSLFDLEIDLQLTQEKRINIHSIYIQRGEHILSRNRSQIKNIINKIKRKDNDDISQDSDFITLENLYSYYQKDTTFKDKWNTNFGIELSSPNITLNYLGSYGFDLFITPPSDKKDISQYYKTLDKLWKLIFKNEYNEDHISLFILMIWVIQPLSHFQNELGKILFQSYILSKLDCEIKGFNYSYISLLIVPDVSKAKSILNDVMQNSKQSEIAPSSFEYWKNKNITIKKILELLNFI